MSLQNRIFVVLVGLFVSTQGFGEDNQAASAAAKPIISSAGVKRAKENLVTLDQNIKDAQANLQTCQKNEEVLASELKQIESFQIEHEELRVRLTRYLDEAQKPIEKNEQELRQLLKSMKAMGSPVADDSAGSQRKQILDKLRQDQLNLESWKIDAENKVKRNKEIVKETVASLNALSRKRLTLKNDLVSWQRRKTEYEKLLEDYRVKKVEVESMISRAVGAPTK